MVALSVMALVRSLRKRVAPPSFLREELVRGCEVAAPGPIPPTVQANALRVLEWRRIVEAVTGPMPVRGWWRPPACNDEREGATRSRHLTGSAIDFDPSSEQRAALKRWLVETGTIPNVNWKGTLRERTPAGDVYRQATGRDNGVGFIMYSGGGLHIDVGCGPDDTLCDARRGDYFDIQR